MFKKLSTVVLVVLFLSIFCIGLKSVQAETFSDLTVTGDAHFQYPIYADGGKIQFGGGDLRIVDFNQGGSRIFNQGDLHMVTDDKLFFDFSNKSNESMAEFASRVQINDNLTAMFPIYAQGNEIVFNGSGVAVKTADGTPRIYRSSDTLRLMAPNMNLDVPGTTTVQNDLTVGGDLQVTGTQTYTGNTTFSGTVTAAGIASLNGGIAVDTNKFTVANTSGNTDIAGTLGVTSATTLSSTLGVTGATTLSSTLGVTGATTLSSTLDVTGATTATGVIYAANGIDETGSDTLLVGANMANAISISKAGVLTTVLGSLNVDQAVTLDTTLDVEGATTLDQTTISTDDGAFAVSGVNAVNINPAGALSLNSSAAAINIGNDAVAQAINIGTGAAARTITIGELTTLTEVQIDGLLVDVNAGATGLTLDSAGAFSIDGADTSNISLASAGADDDLTIAVTGATDSSLVLASSGTAADALTISTSAGGMDITVAGAAAGEDLDILSNSSINLTATEDSANAIYVNANGGTSSTMLFKNFSGTGDNSVTIASTLGGTKFGNAADKSILVDGGTTDKTADAMTFDVDVNSASVDAISIDQDVATALSAGETANGINVDLLGNAADDATSVLNGLYLNMTSTNPGTETAVYVNGAWDTGIDISTATLTNGINFGANTLNGTYFDVTSGGHISSTPNSAGTGLSLNGNIAGIAQGIVLDYDNANLSTATSGILDINYKTSTTDSKAIDLAMETDIDGIATGMTIAMTNDDNAGDAEVTGLDISVTNNDVTGSNMVVGMSIGANSAGATTLDALMGLYNDNTATMADGIGFDTDNPITDAIDASDTDIVNALNVGTNTILGSGSFSIDMVQAGDSTLTVTNTTATQNAAIEIDSESATSSEVNFNLETDIATANRSLGGVAYAADSTKYNINTDGDTQIGGIITLGKLAVTTAGTGANVNVVPTASYIEVSSGNGADTITLLTTGATEGDILIIANTETANAVAIVRDATTKLEGGANVTLSQFETILLVFDGTEWMQIGTHSNNS